MSNLTCPRCRQTHGSNYEYMLHNTTGKCTAVPDPEPFTPCDQCHQHLEDCQRDKVCYRTICADCGVPLKDYEVQFEVCHDCLIKQEEQYAESVSNS